MTTQTEKKTENQEFDIVANSFAKLDVNSNYLELLYINPNDVQTQLSHSIQSPNVWRFSPFSFADSIVVLPVYSTAKDVTDAANDIVSYLNDELGRICKELGVTRETDASAEDVEIANGVYSKLLTESILAINSLVRPKGCMSLSVIADGVETNALELAAEMDFDKDLIHYSTIFAASVIMQQGEEKMVVSTSEVQKTLISGICVGNGDPEFQKEHDEMMAEAEEAEQSQN